MLLYPYLAGSPHTGSQLAGEAPFHAAQWSIDKCCHASPLFTFYCPLEVSIELQQTPPLSLQVGSELSIPRTLGTSPSRLRLRKNSTDWL